MKRAVVLFAAFLTVGCSATTGGTPAPAPSATSPAPSSVAGEPHKLVFDVSGSATLTTLTCTIDGKATEEKSVKLPWTRTFSFPPHTGKHEYKLVMQYTNGDVAATATVDGQPWGSSRGSGEGPSTVSLNGDFSD